MEDEFNNLEDFRFFSVLKEQVEALKYCVQRAESLVSLFDIHPRLWERPLTQRQISYECRFDGVYCVYTEGANALKVGKTKSLKRRLSDLQVGCPFPLKAWRYFRTSNPDSLEDYFHRRLHNEGLGVGGEWFLFDESRRVINSSVEFIRSHIGTEKRCLESDLAWDLDIIEGEPIYTVREVNKQWRNSCSKIDKARIKRRPDDDWNPDDRNEVSQ